MIAAPRAVVAAAAVLCAAACGDGVVSPDGPDGTITARVLIEAQPLADATLLLIGTDGSETSIRTDDDGRGRFERLALGTYTLEASAPGTPAEFDVAPMTVLRTDARTAFLAVTGRWDRTGALTVRVVAGGEPVAGSTVSLVGPFQGYGRIETTGITDVEGRARFRDLVPGTYATSLTAFDASLYSFSIATRAIGIRSGNTAEAVFEGQRLPAASRVAPASTPAYVSDVPRAPTQRTRPTPWSISTPH